MKILQLLLLSSLSLLAWEAPAMPKGELGRMVKLGNEIANNTANHPLTKAYVGNTLACKSCHLQENNNNYAGTGEGLSTWIGTAAVFPAYSKREQTIQTVEDRSNNCFMRSMSGKRLEDGSEASLALYAYISWLSTGIAMKMDDKRPVTASKSQFYADGQKKFRHILEKGTHQNYLDGKTVFEKRCASCHQDDGSGIKNYFPPLWGISDKGKELSFNSGAGLADPQKSAIWIQDNMPLGEHNLTDQESADVALYIDAQPRADFDLKEIIKDLKVYNSKVLDEKHSVRSRMKSYGLDIDVIRGDEKISGNGYSFKK